MSRSGNMRNPLHKAAYASGKAIVQRIPNEEEIRGMLRGPISSATSNDLATGKKFGCRFKKEYWEVDDGDELYLHAEDHFLGGVFTVPVEVAKRLKSR